MSGQKISASQFFIMMFVSRAVVTIGLNRSYLGGDNMLEAIVSYGAAMLLSFVFVLPVRALHRRFPAQNAAAAAKEVMGPAGKFAALSYIVFFLQSGAASLGLFQLFLTDTVAPEFSADLALAAMVLTAVYGAYRGIETVSRCGVCVFALLTAGSLLVFGMAAFRFQPLNLEPLFTHGLDQTFQGTVLFVLRSSIFADLAVLLPWVSGNKRKGFLLWAAGTTLFVSLMLLLIEGCLGPYAASRNFPVYALSGLSESRSLQRLDAVFVGVWMTALIVKIACELTACRVCLREVIGPKREKAACFTPGLLVLLLTLAGVHHHWVQRLLLDTRLLLFCNLLVAVVWPCLILLLGRRREKEAQA